MNCSTTCTRSLPDASASHRQLRSRAEQLIDDFKGLDESTNKELTIAISVDMLDTGIDVPEIVNLVFAKPVKSKVKFWQMIGRGTRLCSGLYGNDENGKPLDKQKFRIFDHWGNFEYHELHTEEAEVTATKSLAQKRFEAWVMLGLLRSVSSTNRRWI